MATKRNPKGFAPIRVKIPGPGAGSSRPIGKRTPRPKASTGPRTTSKVGKASYKSAVAVAKRRGTAAKPTGFGKQIRRKADDARSRVTSGAGRRRPVTRRK